MKISALFFSVLVGVSAYGKIGNEGVGGGSSKNIDQAALEFLITSDDLKKAISHYLQSLQLNKIDDSTPEGKIVKSAFIRMLKDDALLKDLLTPQNYIISNSCQDSFSQQVPASTTIGDLGGKICFNTEKLAQDFRGLTSEQIMIQLASLALHEHTHHFQSQATDIAKNENEAYLVAAYVKLTAQVLQVPLLKWVQPSSSGSIDVGSRVIDSLLRIGIVDSINSDGTSVVDFEGVGFEKVKTSTLRKSVQCLENICKRDRVILKNQASFTNAPVAFVLDVFANKAVRVQTEDRAFIVFREELGKSCDCIQGICVGSKIKDSLGFEGIILEMFDSNQFIFEYEINGKKVIGTRSLQTISKK